MAWGVLLVDDSAAIRQSIRSLFDSQDAFQVVGDAAHGAEAITKAIALRPHLVILDLSMPVMNGFETAPALLQHLPGVIIILLTLFAGEFVESSAREVGIHAVVPKHEATTHLLSTAHALFRSKAASNGHHAGMH